MTAPVGHTVHYRLGWAAFFHLAPDPLLINMYCSQLFLVVEISFILFFFVLLSQPQPPYYPPT